MSAVNPELQPYRLPATCPIPGQNAVLARQPRRGAFAHLCSLAFHRVARPRRRCGWPSQASPDKQIDPPPLALLPLPLLPLHFDPPPPLLFGSSLPPLSPLLVFSSLLRFASCSCSPPLLMLVGSYDPPSAAGFLIRSRPKEADPGQRS